MERLAEFEFIGEVGPGPVAPAGGPLQRADVPLPDFDARTRALEAFGTFLSTLEFRRTGNKGGEPIKFKIPRKSIHIEQPDHVVDLQFPSIVFLPGRASYQTFGLGPARILDDTLGKFGPGTALLNLAEYFEPITVEVWASKRAERRAVMAGIETAITSFDNSWALTLTLKDYFDVSATFALTERMNIEDPESARNRRRGHLYIELATCMVRLVNVNELTVRATVDVVDC